MLFYSEGVPSLRRLGPKSENHPSIGELCPACKKAFMVGDYTTLVCLGPGDSPDAQKRAAEGRSYTAVAIEVHYTCAGGRE